MDEIVTKYGGFSSYQDLENQILVDLQHAVVNLKNANWNAVFLEKRIDTSPSPLLHSYFQSISKNQIRQYP